MNIVSFSLYGNNPMYTHGIIENARLVPIVYPSVWVARVYYGAEVDRSIIECLQRFRAQTILSPHEYGAKPVPLVRGDSKFGKFWRFQAIADPDAQYVICRDCDSRVNIREAAAAWAWVNSGKILHTMKDHMNQDRFPILAGMFGIKARAVDIMHLLEHHPYSGDWYDDQVFLENAVWPLVKHSVIHHGRFGIPFPPHPDYPNTPYPFFVGQRFTFDNKPLFE